MIKPVLKGEIGVIRLIASDLDGTLLEKDGTLPAGIFDMVERLTRMGITFAAASGRQYSNLVRLFAPVAHQMAFVCENGAYNVIDGQEAGLIGMSPEDVRECIADLEERKMNLLVSGKQCCYMLDRNRKFTDDIVYRLRNTVTIVRSWNEITEPTIKVSGQCDCGVADFAPVLVEKWHGRLTATVSGKEWFDFTFANKGMGIEALIKHMGITAEEAVAFGDNYNDESMFSCVGYPFLMEHADPALRKSRIRICQKVMPVLQQIADANGNPDKAFEDYR